MFNEKAVILPDAIMDLQHRKNRTTGTVPVVRFLFQRRRLSVLHACGGDPLIDAGTDAEEHDAYSADGHSHLGVQIALERRQRAVGLRNVHGLHNQQIVVK